MAGEHFIEALVPTRHLLGLQYRNVVAFECTVANLQAQRIKNNYSIHCRNRKKRNVPIIFFKTISVQLKKKLVMPISTFVVVPLYPIIPKEYWVLILPVLSLLLVHTYLLKVPMYGAL